MTSIPHIYNQIEISQISEDTVIGGKLIPKGYVNATAMCKANGKRIAKYYEFSKTSPFLDELKAISGCPLEGHPEIIIEVSGNTQQGTWVSFPVAMNLAQWLSPKFAAWAAITLATVINGDYKALTEEAAEAQAKLQESWNTIRQAGKVTRRRLTDSIKEWYQRNSAPFPLYNMYAKTTNGIYKALWDMDAVQIEEVLGCKRNEARNHLNSDCLMALERAEDRVMEFIDEDNLSPVDAVEAATLRRCRYALV